MKRTIFNMWLRHRTKNLTRIPLFTMTFDYRKYRRDGKPGSCTFFAHPDIAQDEFVKEKLCEVVDHIRDNYDLDILRGFEYVRILRKALGQKYRGISIKTAF